MITIPKVTMSTENKVQSYTEYPKLKLEHGERALIVCIEPEPTVEFKHVLRAPEIGPNGKVLKEIRKTQKGEEYEATVTEFMGQHLCFGDFDTVQENGVDPENCPTCRAAQEEEGIAPPTQHYAMHIIQYSLQPGGWNLRDPFNVDLRAWVFSPNRFNTLVDLATEWGNLQEHDLKLGPCENKNYQKYDINVAASAQWQKDKERAEIVKQTYKNNQSDDLSALIARRISKTQALEDVQKVLQRVAQVNNPGSSAAKPQEEANTSSLGGSDLFKDDDGTEVNTTTGEVSSDSNAGELKQMDFSDIMKDL